MWRVRYQLSYILPGSTSRSCTQRHVEMQMVSSILSLYPSLSCKSHCFHCENFCLWRNLNPWPLSLYSRIYFYVKNLFNFVHVFLPWIDCRCVSCITCGTTNSGFGCQWQNNYTQCGPCSSLVVCPVLFVRETMSTPNSSYSAIIVNG